MIHVGLSQAATLLDCEPLQSDIAFTGITTDSRAIVPGMLFAALHGETHDGHDYIQQAEDLGAVAVLVSRDVDTFLPQLKEHPCYEGRVVMFCLQIQDLPRAFQWPLKPRPYLNWIRGRWCRRQAQVLPGQLILHTDAEIMPFCLLPGEQWKSDSA